MAYWTLAAHPGSFRVEDNVREQDEQLWRTNDRRVVRGDHVAIYKYKGRESHRGVIALGEVLTDPELMFIPRGSDPYQLNSGNGRQLHERTERVRVRYLRPPRTPLWADLGTGSVVDELAVARAQGGTAHRVTAEQWDRLLAEAGQAPWISGHFDSDDAEDEVRQLVSGQGQGLGLSAHERALVERRSMDVVTTYFASAGWTVEDVSATAPFDLRCSRKHGGPLQVEVKGSTGQASAVIVTRGEVLAARSDPEVAVLAIVDGIELNLSRTAATGGVLRIIRPWHPTDDALSPIAYRYQVSATL
jgi:Protein NO VEIN, C-terminal/EVE domain